MTGSKPPATVHSASRLATDIFLLAGFCGFFFFFGLSYFGLVGADEPRYAQVAREMLARHDWVSPTFEGKPWLEKPPFYYWQAMVAFRIFGVSDWAARLPSAWDATLLVAAVYLFLRRFRPGFHLDGALITAASAGFVGFSRAASTDMPLTATFTAALLSWYAWYERRKKTYLALAYLFVGLGVLAKGPIAILLAALVLALFAAITRELDFLVKTIWIPGIVILFAAFLPWYIAVQLKNPDFFRIFILEHNLARFGTNLYHHPEPFWYYLPVMLLALVPWTVFVIRALYENIRAWWKNKGNAGLNDRFSLFLSIWLIVPVVFFSISQSKLPGYIIPSVPAGTLLVAEYIRTRNGRRDAPSLWQIAIHAILASAVLILALMIQYVLLLHRIPWRTASTPLAFAAVCAAAIIVMLRLSGLRSLRFSTLVPFVLAVGIALRAGSPILDAKFSSRPVAQEIMRLQPNLKGQSEPAEVAVFEAPRETEYGLAFYLNRLISRYERHGIPSTSHILIAPAGSQPVVESAVPGRRVAYLGTFRSQNLDYFWVEGK